MKSNEIKAVKHADKSIVKIISGGVVLWDNMINVIVVGDPKGLPVEKIKRIVETNSKYRIVDAIDYSAPNTDVRSARRDLSTRLHMPNYTNRISIFLTTKGGWVQMVCFESKKKHITAYHLLEPEIFNKLSAAAQQELYRLIESTGETIAEFEAAAEYTKEIKETLNNQ